MPYNCSLLESILEKLFLQTLKLSRQKIICTQVMYSLRKLHDETCSQYRISPYPKDLFNISNYEFLEYAYTAVLKVFLELCAQINRGLASISPCVRKAVDFIHGSYNKSLSLNQIAHHVGFNKNYLCSKFKKEMACTVFDFISKVRLDNANELLVCTDLPIALIGRAVGIEDSKYFSTWFRKSNGVSPAEYRKRERGSDV